MSICLKVEKKQRILSLSPDKANIFNTSSLLSCLKESSTSVKGSTPEMSPISPTVCRPTIAGQTESTTLIICLRYGQVGIKASDTGAVLLLTKIFSNELSKLLLQILLAILLLNIIIWYQLRCHFSPGPNVFICAVV